MKKNEKNKFENFESFYLLDFGKSKIFFKKNCNENIKDFLIKERSFYIKKINDKVEFYHLTKNFNNKNLKYLKFDKDKIESKFIFNKYLLLNEIKYFYKNSKENNKNYFKIFFDEPQNYSFFLKYLPKKIIEEEIKNLYEKKTYLKNLSNEKQTIDLIDFFLKSDSFKEKFEKKLKKFYLNRSLNKDYKNIKDLEDIVFYMKYKYGLEELSL